MQIIPTHDEKSTTERLLVSMTQSYATHSTMSIQASLGVYILRTTHERRSSLPIFLGLFPAPDRTAFLHVRLHPFGKIEAAINTRQHIVEGNVCKFGLFQCIQASQCFLGSPDCEWCKMTDLPRHFEH